MDNKELEEVVKEKDEWKSVALELAKENNSKFLLMDVNLLLNLKKDETLNNNGYGQ